MSLDDFPEGVYPRAMRYAVHVEGNRFACWQSLTHDGQFVGQMVDVGFLDDEGRVVLSFPIVPGTAFSINVTYPTRWNGWIAGPVCPRCAIDPKDCLDH